MNNVTEMSEDELLSSALINGVMKGLKGNEFFGRNLAKSIAKQPELLEKVIEVIDPDIVGKALAKEIFVRAHSGNIIAREMVDHILKKATDTAQKELARLVQQEVMHT